MTEQFKAERSEEKFFTSRAFGILQYLFHHLWERNYLFQAHIGIIYLFHCFWAQIYLFKKNSRPPLEF